MGRWQQDQIRNQVWDRLKLMDRMPDHQIRDPDQRRWVLQDLEVIKAQSKDQAREHRHQDQDRKQDNNRGLDQDRDKDQAKSQDLEQLVPAPRRDRMGLDGSSLEAHLLNLLMRVPPVLVTVHWKRKSGNTGSTGLASAALSSVWFSSSFTRSSNSDPWPR